MTGGRCPAEVSPTDPAHLEAPTNEPSYRSDRSLPTRWSGSSQRAGDRSGRFYRAGPDRRQDIAGSRSPWIQGEILAVTLRVGSFFAGCRAKILWIRSGQSLAADRRQPHPAWAPARPAAYAHVLFDLRRSGYSPTKVNLGMVPPGGVQLRCRGHRQAASSQVGSMSGACVCGRSSSSR